MEKLEKLLHYLAPDLDLPQTQEEQEWALRALMNIWEPKVMPAEFWTLQDAYLQEKLSQKNLTGLSDLQEVEPQIYIWQGDITSLQVDAIVNATNSQLLVALCIIDVLTMPFIRRRVFNCGWLVINS